MPTPFGQTFGGQIAGQAIGAGFGLLLGGINDQRQLDQQQKLQDMQILGQEELGKFNYAQQLKMWNATNYRPQVEQMNKAGINPALMYGGTGSGGSTGIQIGSVTGAEAPKGGGEILAQQSMALQLQMQQAQIKNLEANTNKTNAEAANQPIIGENTQAQTALAKINAAINNIQLEVQQGTKYDQIKNIQSNAETASQLMQQAWNNSQISEETVNAKIEEIKQKSIGAALQNEATKSGININNAQIQKMAADISQGWTDLDIRSKAQKLNTWEAEIKAQFPGLGQALGKQFNDVIEGLLNLVEPSRKGKQRTYDAPNNLK